MLFTTIWSMYNGENRVIYVMNMFYMIFVFNFCCICIYLFITNLTLVL